MLKKVTTKEYNNALEEKDSVHKVKAVDATGNDILVASRVVAFSGGCGKITTVGRLAWGRWYRIASSKSGANPNSLLLNVGNLYVNSPAISQLFYISAEGFGNNQVITQLACGGDKCISKARILYKRSTTEGPIIEILVNAPNENYYAFAYSNNIGFVFQEPVEVSETPEEGYSVKEFSF